MYRNTSGYRLRSLAIILVLSPACGIRDQTRFMDVKIRAFLAADMRGGPVSGRNSATGWPRRAMMIVPPSAASRTSSDVRIWSSRTEVVLMSYIVALGRARAFPVRGLRSEEHTSELQS